MKKKRLLTLFGSVCLILVLVALLLPACAKEAPTPVTPTPVTPTPVTPTPAETVYICKWQHSIPAGMVGLVEMGENTGKFIEMRSDGRIKVNFFTGGAIVPGLELWNGVDSGVLDAADVCSCYTMGKCFASAYFCNAPGSLPLWPKMLWMYEGGGLELARKFYSKYYPNVTVFPGGFMLTEPWLYCNKEINSLDDLQGLKVRASGIRAKVYTQLGMAAVGMATDEIIPSMERGVIDGFELAAFWTDIHLGTTDVADYCYLGDEYTEGSVSWGVFNNDWFDKLPEDLQQAVERGCLDGFHYNASICAYNESKYLFDAQQKNTIDARIFPKEIQEALFVAAMQVFVDAIEAGDKETEELWESQWKFYQEWKEFFDAQGYVSNWTFLEELVPAELK